jgi:predicted nuclease of predicted toxin-antitoxin system
LAGYDTVHVRDYEMQSASDVEILLRARDENRIIVSADTDFGSLLTLRTESKPSFVLFRGSATRRPERQIQVLLENLPALTEMLEKGCVVVLNQSRRKRGQIYFSSRLSIISSISSPRSDPLPRSLPLSACPRAERRKAKGSGRAARRLAPLERSTDQ